MIVSRNVPKQQHTLVLLLSDNKIEFYTEYYLQEKYVTDDCCTFCKKETIQHVFENCKHNILYHCGESSVSTCTCT